MPFEKGNKLAKGIGRKGYEYETQQLNKMRIILNKALALTEKIMSGKASFKEAIAYEDSIRIVLKIMDKLHANRQEMKLDIEGEIKETQIRELVLTTRKILELKPNGKIIQQSSDVGISEKQIQE